MFIVYFLNHRENHVVVLRNCLSMELAEVTMKTIAEKYIRVKTSDSQMRIVSKPDTCENPTRYGYWLQQSEQEHKINVWNREKVVSRGYIYNSTQDTLVLIGHFGISKMATSGDFDNVKNLAQLIDNDISADDWEKIEGKQKSAIKQPQKTFYQDKAVRHNFNSVISEMVEKKFQVKNTGE